MTKTEMVHEVTATVFDFDAYEQHCVMQSFIDPWDERHDPMFVFDEANRLVDLYWGKAAYALHFDDIDTPVRLLWKIHHIGMKRWPHATPVRIRHLISAAAHRFGWTMYGQWPATPEARTTSATAERMKLTPSLRYDVLVRDDYRCRACGSTVASGATLHIDHITPISKGGRTVFTNLQALCSSCNLGKGARS